jgi:pimeloyl-ACP methyl ester carboxylesterase
MTLSWPLILLIAATVPVVGLVALLYLAPAAFLRGLMSLARRRAGLVRREVTLADGNRIVFLDGGQGEPLLLLHGFGANKDNFVQIAPYLCDRFRLIIPDIIGFGESSKPLEADYSAPAQADRLGELIRALGITQPIHVGGNSMGGLLTLYFGLRHPNRTASLWLLDPAAIFAPPFTESMRISVEEQRNPFDLRSVDQLAELLRSAFVKPPWIPRPLLAVQLKEMLANEKVANKVFVDTIKTNTQVEIKGMAIPTLIVWGDQDKFVHPGGAEILNKLLPNSRIVMMKDMGHIPQMEAPKQTARDYLAFQSSLAAR